MAQHEYKPFSITARTLGHPRKLFTPITVVNLDPPGNMAAVTINGMWDTGAEFCLISRDLAAKLGINFKKSVNAVGIGGTVDSPLGYVYVALLSNGDLVDTIAAVVEETSPSGEYSFVIGMDFIRKGTLAISSTAIDTTLSFTIPTREPVDFAKLAANTGTPGKYLPLSSSKEDNAPVFGPDVMSLLTRDR